MKSNLPSNAESFVSFMDTVWDGECVPKENGGLTCFQSVFYDDYHDAITTAALCGMIRTGGTCVNNEHWHVYRFPNANDGVRIAPDGNAITYTAHHRRKERPL